MIVKLEVEMAELEGVNCLFRVNKDLVEGCIVDVIDGFVKIMSGSGAEWYPELDVEVVKILFRNQ